MEFKEYNEDDIANIKDFKSRLICNNCGNERYFLYKGDELDFDRIVRLCIDFQKHIEYYKTLLDKKDDIIKIQNNQKYILNKKIYKNNIEIKKYYKKLKIHRLICPEIDCKNWSTKMERCNLRSYHYGRNGYTTYTSGCSLDISNNFELKESK